MGIKEVLNGLRGHFVKVCFYVPETNIDECVQGILREINDSTILLENMDSRLWLTNIVLYLVADFGQRAKD